jgi:uncharacterized glyoxalase superfamily protein PhnB
MLALLVSIFPLTTSRAEEKKQAYASEENYARAFCTRSGALREVLGRFGFEKTAEVPDGDKFAFVMLQKGKVELMYQSFASADKDVGTISQMVRKGPTFLYVEVDNLEEPINAVKGAEVVMPKRTTFYGSTEIGIKDPAGHFVTFAEFGSAQPK